MIDQPISDFMNRDVLRGDEETPIRKLVTSMYSEAQSSFIVCDEGAPVGVITERNTVAVLERSLAGESSDELCARDIMASPAHTLPDSSTMSEVIQIMNTRGFRRVPIVDN